MLLKDGKDKKQGLLLSEFLVTVTGPYRLPTAFKGLLCYVGATALPSSCRHGCLLTSLNMDDTYMTDLAKKLNVDDKKVLRRAKELLMQLSGRKSLTCSESCKVVVCLELATSLNGVGAVHREAAISYAGCRKGVYVNMFNNISKILGLDRVYSVKELCLTLGVSEAEKLANTILEKYTLSQRLSVSDMEHPMYPSAAVAAACKCLKLKVNLSKAVELSRLKKQEFDEFSKSMEAFYETPNIAKQAKRVVLEQIPENGAIISAPKKAKKKTEEELEAEYQEWKRRMLAE